MSDARDPYEVLGVPRWASTQEIRAAYVERARHAHPDLVGGRGLEVMRALNDAWEVLKDQGRRAAYDAANWGATSGPTGDATDPHWVEGTGSRPFWTGAMGRPPGRPSGSVLDFGIYEGWSLGEIYRVDRGYLSWLRDKREAWAIRAEISQLLEPHDEGESGRRHR